MNSENCLPCLTKAELQTQLAQKPNKILLLDVRSAEEYAAQHIPETINMPFDSLAAHAAQLPQNHHLVTVCAKGGGRSAKAAELLRKLGYANAQDLCGGTVGWFEGEEE